jgi:pimeloyl-ACP methyl ester carboxylesterase
LKEVLHFIKKENRHEKASTGLISDNAERGKEKIPIMVLRNNNPWETQTLSSLVSIGTHRLWISTSGPPRRYYVDKTNNIASPAPVVIFLTGGGAPAALYTRVQRALSLVTRVYFYDRTGYDLSERGSQRVLLAEDAARELSTLMTVGIQVPPPYVLVSHSYAGIIARAFLAVHSEDTNMVAGMVLCDTATELFYEMFSPDMNTVMAPLLKGLDFNEVMHVRERWHLTDAEWERAIEGIERSESAADDEDNHRSGRWLAAQQQYAGRAMGDGPVSVVRCNPGHDFRIQYAAGVKAGNGTDEERQRAREFIERLELYDDHVRGSQLRLSTVTRYTLVMDLGHDGLIEKPEILIDEVKWVLERLQERRKERDL